jgi:hypothetical protein
MEMPGSAGIWRITDTLTHDVLKDPFFDIEDATKKEITSDI